MIDNKSVYVKKTVVSNARILIDRQPNLEIGKVEDEIGVSKGYLSRLKNDDSIPKISLELACALANLLCVPLDLLCNVDLSAMTPNEIKVILFIEKLIRETVDANRKWGKFTQSDAQKLNGYSNGPTENPFFNYDGVCDPIFNSRFVDDSNIHITGDMFETAIGNGNWVNLAKVRYSSKQEDDYELYICAYIDIPGSPSVAVHPVCASNFGEDLDLNIVLKKLYTTIVEAHRHLQLSDFVESTIDGYLDTVFSSNEAEKTATKETGRLDQEDDDYSLSDHLEIDKPSDDDIATDEDGFDDICF